MKKLPFTLFIAVLIAGCTDSNYQQEPKISINEHFGETIETYTWHLEKTTYTCLNGTCPKTGEVQENQTKEKECFFCDTPALTENGMELEFGKSAIQDATAGCIIALDCCTIESLEVLEKTPETLKVKAKMSGNYKQSGRCEELYERDFVRDELWTFEKSEK